MRFYRLRLSSRQLSDVLEALSVASDDSTNYGAIYQRVLKALQRQRDKQDAEIDKALKDLKDFPSKVPLSLVPKKPR